jgi:type IV secretory pathway VirJ component
LSQYSQLQLGLAEYRVPLLVGYSSGASVVYATLAQAPDNTFLGAVSMGFEPRVPTQTALCERNGLVTRPGPKGRGRIVGPVSHLPGPWIMLHGEIDQYWPVDSASAFAKAVPGTEFVQLPKVGHGFNIEGNWTSQLKEAVDRIAPTTTESASNSPLDLPVIELPTSGTSTDYFAIVLSGDGGWANIDKQIGEELVRSGVPVVGLNSLQYFWQRRTPDQTSSDLERVIRHYQQAWHRRSVVLVGYSRGADVLPLMASRLPSSLLDQVRLMVFFGLHHSTDLEFRVGDLFGSRRDAAYPLLPEVQKLAGRHLLCVYGTKEKDTLCPELPAGLAEEVELGGGHHFGGDYRALARLVLDHVK